MLTLHDKNQAAKQLNISLAVLEAIISVEANAIGFLGDGRVTILFERHVMYKQLKKKGYDVNRLMKDHPNIININAGGYLGRSAEHDRLNKAKQIDQESAIESTSYGLFQIMGIHWKLLNYQSAEEFERQMSQNEVNQLEAFVRFVTAQPNIHHALQNQDWQRFARLYNGPQYSKNQYDLKLAKAYKSFNT